jgi:ABC-type Fe3+-hydroxamate transport system substrate-binding protein
MSEHVYLLTIGLPVLAVLLIAGMRTLASIHTAKARLNTEESYRALAEKALAAQTEAAAALVSIDASMADVKARLASVEKILKEVE